MKKIPFLLLLLIISLLSHGQWEQLPLTPSGSPGDDLYFNGSMLFYHNADSVYRSADGGSKWYAENYFDHIWLFGVGNDEVALVDGESSLGYDLYISQDNAQSWSILNPPTDSYNSESYLFCKDNTILLGAHRHGTMGNLMFRSNDRGQNWESLSNGIDLADTKVKMIREWGGSFFAVIEGLSTMYTHGIYRSDNGGDSWYPVNSGLTTGPNTSIEQLATTPWGLYATELSTDSMYFSSGGNIWTALPMIGTTYIAPYSIAHYGSFLFAATHMGVYLSRDRGNTWEDFSNGGSPVLNEIVISGSYIIGSGFSGIYRRSIADAFVQNPVSEEDARIGGGMDSNPDTEFVGNENLDDGEFSEWGDEEWVELTDPEFFEMGTCNMYGTPVWTVNTNNLNLLISDRIFYSKGLKPWLDISIAYNTANRENTGMFGKAWNFSYELKLIPDGHNINIQWKDGGKKHFYSPQIIVPGMNIALSHSGPDYDSLYYHGNYWIYKNKKNRLYYRFDQQVDTTARLVSISDMNGNQISISYNTQNKIDQITDAAGRIINFQYNSNGLCSLIQLPDGRSADFTYDSYHQLINCNDLASIPCEYQYDSSGNVLSLSIAGKQTHFSYMLLDGRPLLLSSIDPSGSTIQYMSTALSTSNRLTEITFPFKGTYRYLNQNGRTISAENPSGHIKRKCFTANGLTDSVINYDNHWTYYQYDNRGNLLQKRKQGGINIQFTYNNADLPLSYQNAMNDTWNYQYDTKGNLLQITDPDNNTSSFTYNSKGQLITSTNRNNHTWTYTYDSFGNISNIKDPDMNTQSFDYGIHGYHLESFTNALGNTSAYTYDNNGRLLTTTFPDNTTTTRSYACCGQNSYTNEKGEVYSIQRNSSGLINQRIDPLGNIYETGFNEAQQIKYFKSPLGHTRYFNYDSNGLLSKVTEPSGSSTLYSYSVSGKLLGVSDANSNNWLMTYDSRDFLESKTDPAGNVYQYTFNNNGHLSQIVNARNQTIQYAYNSYNSLVSKTIQGSVFATYQYDAMNKLTSMTDPNGTINFTYNNNEIVNSISYPDGSSVSFSYDQEKNLTSVTYPGGVQISKSHDNRNRLQKITWGNDTISFFYDPAGNIYLEKRSNSTTSEYKKDGNGRLSWIKHSSVSTSLNGLHDLSYDADGNVIAEGIELPVMGALNQGTKNYSYNNLNQLISDGISSYSYDADGNMIAVSSPRNITANYNADNRLTQLTKGNNTYSINWDGLGNIYSIIKNGQTNIFHYDNMGKLLYITDNAGQIKYLIIYRGRVPVAFIDNNGSSFFIHNGKNGNIEMISDQNGSLLNSSHFDYKGLTIAESGSYDFPLAFIGSFGAISLDEEMILTHFRLYDALNGRFVQMDPLSFITGTNMYLFAGNNSVSTTDPYGLEEDSPDLFGDDYSYDNGNEIAGGTAQPYTNDDIGSSFQPDYTEAITNTAVEFSDHPIADFLPSGIANPVSWIKSLNELSNGNLPGAGWQLVPFNNSMTYYYNEKMKEWEKRRQNYYYMPDGRPKLVEKPWCSWY